LKSKPAGLHVAVWPQKYPKAFTMSLTVFKTFGFLVTLDSKDSEEGTYHRCIEKNE
jgi:hypothetical protein